MAKLKYQGARVRFIGRVRSPILHRKGAPRQGDEGAPNVTLEIDASVRPGLQGIKKGDELIVLTWLHQSRRQTLRVHPRGRPELTGVFATRSPDRPNPIGIHPVRVLALLGKGRLRVGPMEAIDGTPVVDLKPVLAKRPQDR